MTTSKRPALYSEQMVLTRNSFSEQVVKETRHYRGSHHDTFIGSSEYNRTFYRRIITKGLIEL